MAKLTAKQREQLPAKAFGLPERSVLEEGEEGVGQLPDARPGSRHPARSDARRGNADAGP